MTRDEVTRKIMDVFSEEFEVETEKITPDANLKDTLGLDSLDYIDLVVVIENNFGFKVKPEDFTTIETFGDFCDYVMSKGKVAA